MRRRRFVLAATVAGLGAPTIAHAQPTPKSAKIAARLVTLARDLEQPWSMAFLPDGRLLITERPGRLRVFANGRLERTPLSGLPTVWARGQAGLLDICLHPSFAQNKVLYLSYISDGPGGPVTTAARAELADGGLRNLAPFFEAVPRRQGNLNLGSRIVFDKAGFLYISCGDRFQMQWRGTGAKDLAGKELCVRLKIDGTRRADNPSAAPPINGKAARPEISPATATRRARCILRPAILEAGTAPRAAICSTS
jgi:glucose/arabinose dehydrogenase